LKKATAKLIECQVVVKYGLEFLDFYALTALTNWLVDVFRSGRQGGIADPAVITFS